MVTGMQFLNVTQAQTYRDIDIPPPAGVSGLVEISSPQNNTVTSKNQILLSITARVGTSTINYIRTGFSASYKGDWEQNPTVLFSSLSSYDITGSEKVDPNKCA